MIEAMRRWAEDGELPAFVYDLGALREHVAGVRRALTDGPELFYAAKANPDARILETVAPYVDGIEVASGGELEHVRKVLPRARLAFGGPGKTDAELALAAREAERIHVESPYELARLASLRRNVDVLLRVNLAGDRKDVALAMSGPFGMDPQAIEACRGILASAPWVRLRGIHAHLASGLDADAMVRQSAEILAWARPWLDKAGCTDAPEFNLGGGMSVDYTDPAGRFDWAAYGRAIAALARPGETLRIEPGRAISVYAGFYVTQVMDVKKAHGQWYAVLRGGTHHLRTPATKNHDQPFTVYRREGNDRPTNPAVSSADRFAPSVGGAVPGEDEVVSLGDGVMPFEGEGAPIGDGAVSPMDGTVPCTGGTAAPMEEAVTSANEAVPAMGGAVPFRGGGVPAVEGAAVTLVGQLCTPKDVFARNVPVDGIAVGDVVAFSMAGAYAWNISHHTFLMHPPPRFHYVEDAPR